MFFIFGFGHKTIKRFGQINEDSCHRCNNNVKRELVKVTTWFTLFFIPIIPYKTQYLLICPICSDSYALGKAEFDYMVKNPEDAVEVDKYTGKTATQIAYLKQMELIRNERSQKGDGDAN
ncbi:MAG: zinc ribbon domain-containing protein [Clostridiales bacterium]|nr:zinc ribbon domain-containing protein [Clostridiales bacterium]